MKKLLLIVLLVMCLYQCFSQFQRMMIPMGQYTINGAAIIPSFCIDAALAVPEMTDLFVKSSSNIFVTKKLGNTTVTKPLSEVNGKWIRLSGREEINGITAEVVNPSDKAIYTLNVNSKSGYLAGKNESLSKNLPDENILKTYEERINSITDEKLKTSAIQDLVWEMPENSSKSYMDGILDKYVNLDKRKQTIIKAFGIDSEITKLFLLTDEILPAFLSEMGKRNNMSDVLSLYWGQKFTDEQLKALADLTGWNFESYARDFDNSILIKYSDNSFFDELEVTTINSKTKIKLDDLNSTNFANQFKDKSVYVDLRNGYFSEAIANWLRDNGVRFVVDFPKILDKVSMSGRVKPIFISSKDPDIAKKLFEKESGIDEIINITREVEHINNAVLVENEQQLKEALSNLSSDEVPLVVFNNGSEGIMFDNPFNPNALKYGISCNSYEYSLFSKSTDFVDFRCVAKAILENQIKYGSNSVSMNEYMRTFQEIYEKCLFAKSTKIKAGLLIVGGAIVGGTIYGYYETHKDGEENK